MKSENANVERNVPNAAHNRRREYVEDSAIASGPRSSYNAFVALSLCTRRPLWRISFVEVSLVKFMVLTICLLMSSVAAAQQQQRRSVPITDTARAHELYVSKDPRDLPGCETRCAAQIADKGRSDSVYAARSRGAMDFRKVTYKSRVDGLEIPAYLFSPLERTGA